MILGNIEQLALNPYRKLGAFGIVNNFQPSSRYLVYFPDTTSTSTMSRVSIPTGTQPPYSWLLAIKGGELSSTTLLTGTGAVTSNMLSGKFMTATLDGVGSLDGTMSLITSLTANLAGVGELTGDMKLTLAMAASLAGVGDLAGSMSLLMEIEATLAGVGGVVADLKGNADLSATIYVNSGAATTQELVSAIWSALAADYNVSGTMGNKLNGAGSAGDPWTTDLSSYNTAGTAGKMVKQIKSIASAGL